MRAFAILVILFLLLQTVGRASCGDPVMSGALNGTFHKVSLDDKCESRDAIAYSLTTGLMSTVPLFRSRQL